MPTIAAHPSLARFTTIVPFATDSIVRHTAAYPVTIDTSSDTAFLDVDCDVHIIPFGLATWSPPFVY